MEASIVLERECLRFNGAGVATEILKQVPRAHQRITQCAMLNAAQEILLATRWQNVRRPDLFFAEHYVEWRFENVSYVFFPKVDDRLFSLYDKVREDANQVVLLVPSNYKLLVRAALDGRENREPEGLFSVEDYLAWRILWATLEQGWSRQRALLWWLIRYNRFLRCRDYPRSLRIRVRRP